MTILEFAGALGDFFLDLLTALGVVILRMLLIKFPPGGFRGLLGTLKAINFLGSA